MAIENYGCTANLAIGSRIESLLRENGVEISPVDEADLVIINSCGVIEHTERKILKRIEELRKHKKIIVTGCLPALREIKGENIIASIRGGNLKELSEVLSIEQKEVIPQPFGVMAAVDIASGCLNSCSYCAVKLAKGELKSRRIEEIEKEVRHLVSRGVKEIEITSQDNSSYGADIGSSLPELLERLCSIDGDFMIRVGMMNPRTLLPLLDEVLEVMKDEKIFKFFHIPVQSGSDRILEKMKRGYTVEDFLEIHEAIRRNFRDFTFSTDIIVGFPGESDEDFEMTKELIKKIEPDKLNITRYSPRRGTEAYGMGDIHGRIKKARSRELCELHRRISLSLNRKLLGRVSEILLTEEGRKGGVVGRDPCYRNVVIRKELPLG
ncbi:MAG: tRNA (N(6)-L-threonylcarbamoyladenosine(37)-C(2))-methylthiotransferase, partial [Archaeoglobi archaeon]|nr:tRNA (N(6)-L-threonylcarbamoyladenosine(37)-C(2))-methylthiotransferase [Candidatus Mnemosynella bozhongmuii]